MAPQEGACRASGTKQSQGSGVGDRFEILIITAHLTAT